MIDLALQRRTRLLHLLSGMGIEIGALHQPVHAPHLKVRYVDRVLEDTLRRHYAELGEMRFVPIDIHDDGQTLQSLEDESEDFIIANHVIEHMSDPIRALENWSRVLKRGARLFMAVPDKDQTFDRNRPLTTLQHLVEDYEAPSPDRDFEAFLEFALEVSAKIAGACKVEEAAKHAELMWKEKYSIHYHVWNQESFAELLEFLPGYLPGYALRVHEFAPTLGEEFLYVLEKT